MVWDAQQVMDHPFLDGRACERRALTSFKRNRHGMMRNQLSSVGGRKILFHSTPLTFSNERFVRFVWTVTRYPRQC
ncbi:hypothetical protein HNY73_014594 [Argiope bruennichi]|uniref:Uncharacterized protein n=1 Tax=Argiope bruennichi TaxID=94029 RepID=A0A8T0EQM6_ARGBR|nr:hypothetical protein HNY73_014594 [Argiope bruennichi]